MSSPTWTPGEPLSETRQLAGECWRVVEAQHRVSTMKLTDTVEEQALLEGMLEATKPPVPEECVHLDYLLYSPFRYRPYPKGSRFRRPGMTPGVFYAAEFAETAVAEMAFYRVLFFAESPSTPWPANPAEYTAFSVTFRAKTVDLMDAPYLAHSALWTNLSDHGACQDLAEAARAAACEAIRYRSVRDPEGRSAIAILTCHAFTCSAPVSRRTWRMHLGSFGVRAICEFPSQALEFGREAFSADPRLAEMTWSR
jgi:hypothetical protein